MYASVMILVESSYEANEVVLCRDFRRYSMASEKDTWRGLSMASVRSTVTERALLNPEMPQRHICRPGNVSAIHIYTDRAVVL